MTEFATAIVCHDDAHFLDATLKTFAPAGPATVFVSKYGWDSSTGDYEASVSAAERANTEVVLVEEKTEESHRRFALAEMRRRGVQWLFIPDGDELVERKLLDELMTLARTDLFDQFRVRMHTYWKSARYRIYPPENIAPAILINAQTCEHIHIREYSAERPITLGFEHGVLHHALYAGPDARIRRKLESWSHRDEVRPDWWENVWLAWDRDRTVRNLHPTHPECYGFAERIQVPEILRLGADERPALGEPPLPANWLSISAVVPVYGGCEDLFHCLQSAAACGVAGAKRLRPAGKRGARAADPFDTRPPLLHEVIVVDDYSPEDITDVVRQFPFVKLLRNEENIGYGQSCNRGILASTGDAVLPLNSDVRLPRAALIRMGDSLMSSGTIGAVGPITNNCGYFQRTDPTMTDLKNLERFACDFAHREVEDRDESFVVGFATLYPRRVLDEVGLFDPRYGKALYEDTDLIHRILRRGYRALVCERAFVHHEGSKSLGRLAEHPRLALARNKEIFRKIWSLDLETGFADALAGDKRGRITFNPDREPSVVIARLKKLAHKARISVWAILCRTYPACMFG